MGLAARLDRLVPDLSATLMRFPVPAALSLTLCTYLNIFSASSSDDDFAVACGAAAGFIGAGAAHLFAEGRGLPRLTGIVMALAAAVAAAILGYFTRVFSTNLLFFFAGLVPVLMVAPYLRHDAKQGAFWLFNLRFGLAALLAIVVALLFAAGLSAIVEALNLLFGAGISGDLHEHIWFTAMSLVAPVYGLSLMPRELDEEVRIAEQKGTLLERGISVLINYVLAPVIVVYALILHAYAVKIVINGELPEGQIAIMVTIFAIGGTGAWLAAWPWREDGTRLLRLFMRYWFFLLIVPAVLLAIAIWRRLTDYGVTPDRYGIALVALWVAGLALYLALRRNRADMRAILGGMAVLLLTGSVGPMGANGLTVTSQFARLAALLEKAGVLKDGKVTPPSGVLPGDAGSQGYSILYALQQADGLGRLRPWFEGQEKDPFSGDQDDWALSSALAERLGFTATQPQPDMVNFSANAPLSLSVMQGGRLVGPLQAFQNYNPAEPQKPMTAIYDNTTLTIRLQEETYRIGLGDLLAKTKARLSANPSAQPAIAIEIAPGVTIAIDSIYGNLNSTPPLNGMRFWLILRQAP